MATIDNPATVAPVDQTRALQWMLNNKTDYTGIASGLTTLTKLPQFTQPAAVQSLYRAFYNDSALEDVTGLNFNNITQYYLTFYNCSSLKVVPTLTGKKSYTQPRFGPSGMFSDCSALESVTLGANFVGYNMTDCSTMFLNCSSLRSIVLDSGSTLNISHLGGSTPNLSYGLGGLANMFKGCTSLTTIPNITINSGGNWNIAGNLSFSASGMFSGCSSLTSLQLSFSTNARTGLTSCSQIFQDCTSLTTARLNGSDNCTIYASAFDGCSSLSSLNSSGNLRLSGATDLSNMFRGCTSLSNTSLNKILNDLVSATNVATKTLAYLGLTETQATTCTGLSNWAALSAAGWTTGY